MSLWTETKLVLFYGIPLGDPEDGGANLAMELDEHIEFHDDEEDTEVLLEALRDEHIIEGFDNITKGAAGLFSTPTMNQDEEGMVFGVVLETFDMLHESHHNEIGKASKVTKAIEAKYAKAAAKLPLELKAFVKRQGKGKPRIISVLMAEDN